MKGGEATFDASPQPGPECTIEAGADAEASWPALYADYFGPTGVASCGREPGNCHGGANDLGIPASGYVCTTEAECYASLTGKSHLVRIPEDVADAGHSILIAELRHKLPNGTITGSMPKRPSNCVFSPEAVARIEAWMASGAEAGAP